MAAMTFGAAVVRGLTGFGMAIILVPLLALVIPPVDAVVVGIMLQMLIGPVGLPVILRAADRRSALTIAAIAMATTPLGLLAVRAVTPDMARLLIALVAIGAFVAIVWPKSAGVNRPRPALTAFTGAASGVLNGFAAMPGPPVVPYYLSHGYAPAAARASMMLVFALTGLAGTLVAAAMGTATWELAALAGLLFLPMVAGNWLGGLGFGRVTPPVWRGAVALVLGGAAVAAVVRLVA